jgi:NAD(P)-dependent dehydrogenase (short-subunit alcohol dehydrogenase family)
MSNLDPRSNGKRVALVTGASGALGGALTRGLAAESRLVVAVGRGASQAELDRDVGEGRTLAAAFDVTEPSAWTQLLEELSARGDHPTAAVLAAGAWRGGKPLHEETDDATWESMLSANLTTARVSLRALLPGMLAAGGGSVVLVGSRAAVRPWESARAAAYAASKAALLALAQAVAAEVLDGGVRINVVLPATIDTPQNRAAMKDADTSRWVTPESLTEVVSFLLSERARDVSGAVVPVYGRAGV